MYNDVICYSIDPNTTVENSIMRILETERDLQLKNKYYESTLRLSDASTFNQIHKEANCLAIIFYANGQTLTTDLLDEKFKIFNWVGDGPRIIICDKIDDGCPSYRSFLDWSIKNEFEMILAEEEDAKKQIIDSLSAFHWPNMITKRENDSEKQLMDFESIFNKMTSFKNLPPELLDDKLDEIQELFSKLIDFDDEDDEPHKQNLSSDSNDKCNTEKNE